MNKIENQGVVHALLLCGSENDRRLVRDVFRKSGWRLFEARDGRRALQWVQRNPVQVVIAEGDGWKQLLEDLRELTDPPQLVVTSRTADDVLWADVLNRGGFDVLPQPFDRDELERVVAAAGRHFCSLRPASVSVAVTASAAA